MATAPRWYFDFISPFAYLQWRRLRPALAEFGIVPVPILFAAVLDRLGNKGPAEIPHKRAFTYRHVLWRARQRGVPLRFPPAHPFNPLPALRLAVAAGTTEAAIDAIFEHVWARGEAADAVALTPLCTRLGVTPEALAADAVKSALRANTDEALSRGVFGVPTLALRDALFWGDDAHDFALAALRDPALLNESEMMRVSTLPEGVRRG